MNIVFAGTPEFAVPSLRALARGGRRVVAVYTQPDRPAGRGRKVAASAVKVAAVELGIPVEQPPGLRDPAVRERLAEYRPDLIVVAAYGLILPPDLLDLPGAGCINVHASLLPRWRGAAPVQHALLAGDAKTGATIMRMDEGVDTGDVLFAGTCPIRPDDTAGSLTGRLASLGAEVLLDALAGLEAGGLEPRPQDESAATRAPRIRKCDARIDWSRDARDLERMVRAFDPWPVAFTSVEGRPLHVLKSEALPSGDPADAPPGTLVRATPRGIEVQAGRGRLRLERVQRPGKRAMDAHELLNGWRLRPGQRLGDEPDRGSRS